MTKGAIQSEAELRSILEQACQERELLILVTPYLRFESRFLALEGDALHVRATMSAEEAQFGLRSADLRFRFPHHARFLEARTRLLGFGLLEGRRTLRLALPGSLRDEDQRRSYRVERVGRVEVTFSTPKFDLHAGLLVNLSTTGARISASRGPLEGLLQEGDLIRLSIPLSEELRLDSPVKVCWIQGRTAGLEFHPGLSDPVLSNLSRWVFLRREEERDRIPARAPLTGAPAIQTPACLVLVSTSEALAQQLREQLAELPELRRVDPSAQALKEAVAGGARLVLFHLPATGLDERRRLRPLAETLPARLPFVLLGTDTADGVALMAWGQELRAASSYILPSKAGSFFPRLVQGILRRFAEGFAS